MKSICLIDLSGIWRANWSVCADKDNAAEALTLTVARVQEFSAKHDYCGICLDTPPYRRKQSDPSYKAQREPPEARMLDLYAQTKRRLADEGFQLFSAPGYEADDVIATLVGQAVADWDGEITIVSADKDLLQLVSDKDRVRVFSPQSRLIMNEAEVFAKYGVTPTGLRDWLALVGDKPDNIPGVKGCGEVTAALVVNSGPGLDGALKGESIKHLTPRLASAIADAKNQVLNARKLVTLERDAPVDLAVLFAPRQAQAKPIPDLDVPRPRSEPPPRPMPPVDAQHRVVTTEIVRKEEAPRALAPVENWDEGISVARIVARVDKVREIHSRVMKEGYHYGKVPGTSKDTLLKPGAELLGLTFQLDPQFSLEERREGDHLETIVTCTLFHAPTGMRLGSGIGSCSTRESKYAWRKGDRLCPKCKKPAIRKSNFGGWYCNAKADGCNAKFDENDRAITGQQVGRAPNPDLPDQHNTVRKMACKRAHVAAILFVTCASEIFTQDVEDMQDGGDDYDQSDRWRDAPESTPQREQQRQRGAA